MRSFAVLDLECRTVAAEKPAGFLVFNEDIAFRLSFEHCARHVEEAAGASLDGVRSYFRTEQERPGGCWNLWWQLLGFCQGWFISACRAGLAEPHPELCHGTSAKPSPWAKFDLHLHLSVPERQSLQSFKENSEDIGNPPARRNATSVQGTASLQLNYQAAFV